MFSNVISAFIYGQMHSEEASKESQRWRDRQIERHIDGKNKEVDRHRDGGTERLRNVETDMWKDREMKK